MATTLMDILDNYNTEKKCRRLFERIKWYNGIACTRCGSLNLSRHTVRKIYECMDCWYYFSVTAGTALHRSNLPLRKWVLATYLMCESKKGMSALQVQRMLDVAPKTAWYLNHRIRFAMSQLPPPKLNGIVEVDETWVGGRNRGRYENPFENKTLVVGIVERRGDVIVQVVRKRDRRTLHRFVLSHIDPNVKAIFTDQHHGYRGLPRHEAVNHSQYEWARGEVHTNTIEGVWALLKRSIMGAYHHVSPKYLDLYIEELAWKYNNRHRDKFLLALRELLRDGNYISYEELTENYK